MHKSNFGRHYAKYFTFPFIMVTLWPVLRVAQLTCYLLKKQNFHGVTIGTFLEVSVFDLS